MTQTEAIGEFRLTELGAFEIQSTVTYDTIIYYEVKSNLRKLVTDIPGLFPNNSKIKMFWLICGQGIDSSVRHLLDVGDQK